MTKAAKVLDGLDRDIFGEEYHSQMAWTRFRPWMIANANQIPGHLPASKIAGWTITKGLSTINSAFW